MQPFDKPTNVQQTDGDLKCLMSTKPLPIRDNRPQSGEWWDVSDGQAF